MPAARLGAWLRHTGERWAKAAFAEKLAVLLALGAVLYTIVTGAAELRYQARAREALAQVKAARLAASAVVCPVLLRRADVRRPDKRGRLCERHRQGNPHAGLTARHSDAFADRPERLHRAAAPVSGERHVRHL